MRGRDALSSTEHRFVEEAVRALPGPEWLGRWRLDAFERFAGAELPTEAEEVWRYSRIGQLDLADYDPPTPATAGGRTAPSAAVEALLASIGERAALVTPFHTEISEELEASEATVRTASDLARADQIGGHPLVGTVADTHDALGDLAQAFMVDALIVAVPAGVTVEHPIVLVHEVDGSAAFPRTIVTLGPGASAKVVEVVVSGADAAQQPQFAMPVAELDLGEGAQLAFHSVQDLSRRTFAITHHASRLRRDAKLTSLSAAFGGSYARCRTDSRLEGEGASAQLLAAYFGDGDQMHDFRTLQEHVAPRTKSDLLFKGAVSDTAHSVYTGLIRILPGAKGSDAFQTNRNLVLSDGAHADSVPNLDIQENDVRCSHASAVGPIDADQRYYLESRGIPAEVAERLILVGFFEDLFARSTVTGLRDHLAKVVADRVAEVIGA